MMWDITEEQDEPATEEERSNKLPNDKMPWRETVAAFCPKGDEKE